MQILRRGALALLTAIAATAVLSAQAPAQTTATPTQPRARIIQRVIVKVNGEIFTETDLVQRQIEALRDKNQQVNNPEDLKNDAVLAKAVAEVTPDILVDSVDELLMVQHGREQGYKLTDDRFKTIVDNVKKDNKLDDTTLKSALAEQGMTLDTYRQMVERQLIIHSVQQDEIMQKASLTDEEAHQYYDKHPNDFMRPATVTLREIAINIPTTKTTGGQASFSVGDDKDALAKIQAIRDRAVKGEDFTKLVAELSESGTKANAGLIGPVSTTDLAEKLADTLSKMKPGDITEPLRTPTSYQILKLESRTETARRPFDEVRDDIAQKVYGERLDVEQAKFLVKLRQQALIEWKDDAMKLAYEKRVAERSKAQPGTGR